MGQTRTVCYLLGNYSVTSGSGIGKDEWRETNWQQHKQHKSTTFRWGPTHPSDKGDDRITFGTMDIERRERIDNNINVRVERAFERSKIRTKPITHPRAPTHPSDKGDDRITFGTMDIERRERIDNNINVRVEQLFERSKIRTKPTTCHWGTTQLATRDCY